MPHHTPLHRSRTPGVVLGIGLGAFADGIGLHQIAQWHNMGSARLPPVTMDAMKQNMAWDGWFHAVALGVTVCGLFLFVRDARRGVSIPRPRIFTGQLLIGWAAFNLVEGVADHHLLQLHHVRDLPQHVPLYDWAFLLLGGVALLWLGRALMKPRRGDGSGP